MSIRYTTRDQALAHGIPGHVWDQQMGHGAPRGASTGLAEPVQRGGRRATSKDDMGRNKTEAAFDRHLADQIPAGRINAYAFEPFNLRLGGRCHLRIDFGVWLAPNDQLIVIDVKGWMEEDASVKLRTAANKYPKIPVYVVYRGAKGRGWILKTVNRSGIVVCDGSFLGI